MTDRQFGESIRRILKDDRDALKEVYEDYNSLIYSVVLDIVHSREDAEDVTSEFFIKLWNIADKFHDHGGHRAWMITIARNMALDHIRKRQREEPVDVIPETDADQFGDEYSDLVNNLSLQDALKTLKEEERQVVNLKFMGELTFKEIARILGKPQGTVTWLYGEALKKLKEVQL